MNPIEAALRRVAADFGAAGRRWAIVGGLAVSARAEPRTTRDIVVLLREAGPEEVEHARGALHLIAECGYQRGKNLIERLEDRFASARSRGESVGFTKARPGATRRVRTINR